MNTQPNLSEELPAFRATRFLAVHRSAPTDPADPTTDTAHIHTCYEIYVNVTGQVSFLVNRDVYPIHPGDAVITRPGDLHYCIPHEPCLHEHFCVWLDAACDPDIPAFLEKHGLFGISHPAAGGQDALLAALRDLCEGGEAPTFRFWQLLHLLAAGTEAHEDAELPGLLREIIRYMDREYAGIQSVREVAEAFFISQSTIDRLFRRYVHLTPHDFLQSKKLACAERLIRGGTAVTEACYAAGFADCSRFIALFRKKYGQTPLQYRKSL